MNPSEKRPLTNLEEARVRHAARMAAAQPDGEDMRAEFEAFMAPDALRKPQPAPAEEPAAAGEPVSGGDPAVEFKPLVESDIVCLTCGTVIRPYQRGAFYTECRKCGMILRP